MAALLAASSISSPNPATNDFHGSVYDYLQNNATDARSLFSLRRDANTLCGKINSAATLGGPIKKDKIFFFTNYEGQRRGETPTYPPLS